MFNSLINYFQTLELHPVERLAFLVGGLLLLWLLEGAIPLLALTYRKNKIRHAAVNFSFTLIHLVIHTGFAVLIVLLSDWSGTHGVGLVHWTKVSAVAAIIITIFTLDFFAGYLVHFMEHKIGLLWRFHIIHHSDNHVDVTTGLRHHPFESVLRGLFMLIGVVVAGAPMYAVMIFQTLLVLSTQISHANISLPAALDNTLSYFFISPNMHKVHHHYKQPFTDSNYGAIFSIWDRLFGTFARLAPKHIHYGLDRYYDNKKDEDLVLLLKHPFRKGIRNIVSE